MVCSSFVFSSKGQAPIFVANVAVSRIVENVSAATNYDEPLEQKKKARWEDWIRRWDSQLARGGLRVYGAH